MATVNLTLQFGCRLLIGVFLVFTASAQMIDEYRVKAAFLYNFTKFVEWPVLTFKTDKDPVRICILGQDPFGSALGEAVGGKTVLGRPLVVTDVSNAGQATACQILFIGSSERKRLRAIFAELPAGVLTVGETEGFGAQGGIVNFKLEDGHVRLEINVEAAGLAKLRINSRVLNLAQIVSAGTQKQN